MRDYSQIEKPPYEYKTIPNNQYDYSDKSWDYEIINDGNFEYDE
jgi:hypothetical protein